MSKRAAPSKIFKCRLQQTWANYQTLNAYCTILLNSLIRLSSLTRPAGLVQITTINPIRFPRLAAIHRNNPLIYFRSSLLPNFINQWSPRVKELIEPPPPDSGIASICPNVKFRSLGNRYRNASLQNVLFTLLDSEKLVERNIKMAAEERNN